MSEMTPREIVSELDKHIIGQDAAKRSVAIALRNRWRRMQLDEELRHFLRGGSVIRLIRPGVGGNEQVFGNAGTTCGNGKAEDRVGLGGNVVERTGMKFP